MQSIEIGYSAFEYYQSASNSTLIMKGDNYSFPSLLDLYMLTTLTTVKTRKYLSSTFANPHHIVASSHAS